MVRIGVLLGSNRPSGNILGLERWINNEMLEMGIDSAGNFELVHIFPNAPMHPLGPIEDDIIPALVGAKDTYTSDKVSAWSSLVASCQAFVILTPQHNWGYPGELKTALDHLYHEWNGKPVMIATYGGHGGGKCYEQLRQVLTGLKMQVIDESVQISLPAEYIRSSSRLSPNDFEYGVEMPDFIKIARVPLQSALTKLKLAAVEYASQES